MADGIESLLQRTNNAEDEVDKLFRELELVQQSLKEDEKESSEKKAELERLRVENTKLKYRSVS